MPATQVHTSHTVLSLRYIQPLDRCASPLPWLLCQHHRQAFIRHFFGELRVCVSVPACIRRLAVWQGRLPGQLHRQPPLHRTPGNTRMTHQSQDSRLVECCKSRGADPKRLAQPAANELNHLTCSMPFLRNSTSGVIAGHLFYLIYTETILV